MSSEICDFDLLTSLAAAARQSSACSRIYPCGYFLFKMQRQYSQLYSSLFKVNTTTTTTTARLFHGISCMWRLLAGEAKTTASSAFSRLVRFLIDPTCPFKPAPFYGRFNWNVFGLLSFFGIKHNKHVNKCT